MEAGIGGKDHKAGPVMTVVELLSGGKYFADPIHLPNLSHDNTNLSHREGVQDWGRPLAWIISAVSTGCKLR